MKTYVIDNGSKYIDDLLEALKEQDPILVSFDSLTLHAINTNDLVILSGGHGFPVLWHDKEYMNEIQIIKKHEGPIIGICLGFQLISHVYGSHLHRLENRQKGIRKISASTTNSIVHDGQSILVYENHNWAVKKLNKPLIALAHSLDGVEVLKHVSRPLYGMQFHPESKEGDGSIILMNIMNELKRQNLIH
jgi:anthranilate/para-aminobenzoate synthase component II